MKKITEDIIEDTADSYSIFSRGKNYYKNGRVTIYKIDKSSIRAKVRGSSIYDVEIDLEDSDDDKMKGVCSCPYPSGGCKHVVAVLFKYLEMNKNLSKKKNKYPFKNLKFEDSVRNQERENIIRAFDVLNQERIKIEEDGMGFMGETIAKIEDGGKNYSVSIKCGSKYRDFDEYEHDCSCNKDSYYHPCEHILATYFFILKKNKPNKIPKDYEKKLRDKLNHEKYMEFVSLLSEKDEKGEHGNKNKYKILFEIEKENEALYIAIKKVYLLKNGEYGNASSVNKHIIEEIYPELTDLEKRIIDILNYEHSYRGHFKVRIENHPRSFELLKNLRDLYSQNHRSIIGCLMPNEKALVEVLINNDGEGEKDYSISPKIKIGEQMLDFGKQDIILIGNDRLWAYIPGNIMVKYSDDDLLVEIETDQSKIIKKLAKFSGVKIKQRAITNFIEKNYINLSRIGNIELPEKYKPEEKISVPMPRLFLKDYGSSFSIELKFLYGDQEVAYGNDYDILYKDEKRRFVKIKRNKEEEEKFIQKLCKYAENRGEVFIPIGRSPLEWLFDSASGLITDGFEIFGKDKLVNYKISNQRPQLKLDIQSGIDWFDLKADVGFGKEKVPFENILNALKNHERFVKLSNGRIGAIPKKWLSKIAGVIGFFDKCDGDGRLRATRSQIGLVESLLEVADKSNCDIKFKEIQNKFKNFKGIKEMQLPKSLKGELRPYQKAGYDWLHFLKEFSFGGCLADEMGLGKTLQIISLLLYEKENGNNKSSLVVVPTSLVFNWVKEIEKFAPSLKAYVHHGQARLDKLRLIEEENANVIIITYGILQNDLDLFKDKKFYYVILDESQKIKNPLSKNAKSALSLKSEHRLVLTGTPVENNLLELWSQFAFLNPGLLGNMNYFKEVFMKNIERSVDIDKTTALKNMINPFLLMRKKETVAKDLPEKQVMTLYCEMEGKQKEFYEVWKEKYRREIKNTIESRGFMQSKMKIIEGLTRLRQICNHPLLVDESFPGTSSKFEIIVNKVEEAIKNGHKVLLFSSFVKMLHLLRDYFAGKGIKFAYLDGSTRNREEVVKEFQENGEVKLFLISIKAGGLGLNLTAADYVFIVDPWWNPAVEMQAMDRTHRIGQDKSIFVYKTIVKDSVEEKILELQDKKMEMTKNVITSEQGIFKQLNAEDINYMFG